MVGLPSLTAYQTGPHLPFLSDRRRRLPPPTNSSPTQRWRRTAQLLPKDIRPSIDLAITQTSLLQSPHFSTMSKPHFWTTPLRYLRWASHERPAYFWSIVIGSVGPVTMVIVPPIRRVMGDVRPEPIPLTYPGRLILDSGRRWLGRLFILTLAVPPGPRVIPKGYDDE